LLSNGHSAVATRIRLGRPAEEIVTEAGAGDYDLVIVGERPGRNLKKRIFGSVVERLIAVSPCPILIARRRVPLQRFLICEGGRRPSLVGRLTTRLAPLLRDSRQIVVLHVMSQLAATPVVSGWELQADAEAHMRRHTLEGELLHQDIQTLQQAHTVPQVKLRHGLVVDEVVAEARDGDYDLVVIGAHRQAGWQRFLLDDLAHQIILHTTQPLLVVV
jgi:nucleotide-binding universal stress UspA family protein